MAKIKKPRSSIQNRRARFDYSIDDNYILGISLTGAETKSLRFGHGQLTGSYVTVKDGSLWLINSLIQSSPAIPISEADQTRSRQLLAKKREIDGFIQAKQQGMSIIPLEFITNGRYIKLKVGVGKGLKKFDKRQVIKKRDEERAINNALKRQSS